MCLEEGSNCRVRPSAFFGKVFTKAAGRAQVLCIYIYHVIWWCPSAELCTLSTCSRSNTWEQDRTCLVPGGTSLALSGDGGGGGGGPQWPCWTGKLFHRSADGSSGQSSLCGAPGSRPGWCITVTGFSHPYSYSINDDLLSLCSYVYLSTKPHSHLPVKVKKSHAFQYHSTGHNLY